MLSRSPISLQRTLRSYIKFTPIYCFRGYATEKQTETKSERGGRERGSSPLRSPKAIRRQKLEDSAKQIENLKTLTDSLKLLEEKLERDELKKKKSTRTKVRQSAGVRKSRKPREKANIPSKGFGALSKLIEGWKGEERKDGWGTDTLSPKDKDVGDVLSRSKHGLILPPTHPQVLEDIVPPSGSREIATLCPGLDRALFNPGVHWIQDLRSGVYNFDRRFQIIPDVTKFDFKKVGPHMKSSMDNDLHEVAVMHKKSFAGSTSSLTGLLSHIYFLISQYHPVNTSALSKAFRRQSTQFTRGQRMPVSLLFRHRDGVHSIDSIGGDANYDQFNILMWQGTMLEKFLTYPEEKFNGFFGNGEAETEVEGRGENAQMKEAYRYSKSDAFVMRSQLDGRDPRLPGTGVFDIKTRAALPLRLDVLNYKEHSGYRIVTSHGPTNSFEREYYDLIRSAFLKYSFQARIGAMDGVFVAYHNTARIFGFQYIPLEEMDEGLYGGRGRERGERVFERCVKVMEVVCREVVACFEGMSVTCTAETRVSKGQSGNVLRLWVQPAGPIPLGSTTPGIVELDLRVESYLGEERASGTRAVDDVTMPWTIHYTVSRSHDSEGVIRRRFEAAKRRQQYAYSLPTGVSFDQLQSYWEGLGWSLRTTESDSGAEGQGTAGVGVDQGRFRTADKWIQGWRYRSRVALKRAQELDPTTAMTLKTD